MAAAKASQDSANTSMIAAGGSAAAAVAITFTVLIERTKHRRQLVEEWRMKQKHHSERIAQELGAWSNSIGLPYVDIKDGLLDVGKYEERSAGLFILPEARTHLFTGYDELSRSFCELALEAVERAETLQSIIDGKNDSFHSRVFAIAREFPTLTLIDEKDQKLHTIIKDHLLKAAYFITSEQIRHGRIKSTLDKISSNGNVLLRLNNNNLIAYSQTTIDKLENALVSLATDKDSQEKITHFERDWEAFKKFKNEDFTEWRNRVERIKGRIEADKKILIEGKCSLCEPKPSFLKN